MLHALRRSRWFVSPIALSLAVYVFLGTADWWHGWDDDQDPARIELFHDHAAHRAVLESEGQAGTPEHCYLCHWLRSLGNGLGRGSLHAHGTQETRGVSPGRAIPATASFASQVPARAPPA